MARNFRTEQGVALSIADLKVGDSLMCVSYPGGYRLRYPVQMTLLKVKTILKHRIVLTSAASRGIGGTAVAVDGAGLVTNCPRPDTGTKIYLLTLDDPEVHAIRQRNLLAHYAEVGALFIEGE